MRKSYSTFDSFLFTYKQDLHFNLEKSYQIFYLYLFYMIVFYLRKSLVFQEKLFTYLFDQLLMIIWSIIWLPTYLNTLTISLFQFIYFENSKNSYLIVQPTCFKNKKVFFTLFLLSTLIPLYSTIIISPVCQRKSVIRRLTLNLAPSLALLGLEPFLTSKPTPGITVLSNNNLFQEFI